MNVCTLCTPEVYTVKSPQLHLMVVIMMMILILIMVMIFDFNNACAVVDDDYHDETFLLGICRLPVQTPTP